MLKLFLPIQAGLSMKGLFTLSSIEDLDILSDLRTDQSQFQSSDLKKISELSTEDPYTSSSDLELENLITSNNVMI